MQLMGESVHRDGLDSGVTQPRFHVVIMAGRLARPLQITRQHGPEPGMESTTASSNMGWVLVKSKRPAIEPAADQRASCRHGLGLPKGNPFQRAREQQWQHRVQDASLRPA